MLLPQAAWEKANLLLFSLINAPASPGMTMLALGNLFANWVIFLFPLLLLAQWFFGAEQGKRLALNTSVSVAIALLFNLAIGLLWQHPRPFMVPVGHHFLAHSADSSFPSDHLSVAFAVSFSGNQPLATGRHSTGFKPGNCLGSNLSGGAFPARYSGFSGGGPDGGLSLSTKYPPDRQGLSLPDDDLSVAVFTGD
nr:hypothetical protein [Erwinia mallotivora]